MKELRCDFFNARHWTNFEQVCSPVSCVGLTHTRNKKLSVRNPEALWVESTNKEGFQNLLDDLPRASKTGLISSGSEPWLEALLISVAFQGSSYEQ